MKNEDEWLRCLGCFWVCFNLRNIEFIADPMCQAFVYDRPSCYVDADGFGG
jgi:hypothetical protein